MEANIEASMEASMEAKTEVKKVRATITENAILQYVLGAILVIGVGVFLLYDKLFNTDTFAALVGTYGLVSIAAGIHLMETDNGINRFWKYIGIIVIATAEFGIAYYASLPVLTVTSVAAAVIAIATFFIHDINHYEADLPAEFVSNSALIVGGIITVAQAVQSQSPTSLQAVIAIIVTTALMYFYSKFIPQPS